MKRTLFALVAMMALASCSREKALDPERLRDLHRIAIVAHVDAPASSDVFRENPKKSSARAAEEADLQLAKTLAAQMKRFEIQERLRTALLARLPATPPWSTALPAVEVATALESLLVEDRSGDIDFKALEKRGADAVLDLSIHEFGMHTVKGRTGLYVKGDARLFTIEGSTLFKAPLDVDDAVNPQQEELGLDAARQGGFRDAMVDALGRVADRLATSLGEREEGPQHPAHAAETTGEGEQAQP